MKYPMNYILYPIKSPSFLSSPVYGITHVAAAGPSKVGVAHFELAASPAV